MPKSRISELFKRRPKPAEPTTSRSAIPTYEAAHKVLQIYELLEHILTFADPETLRSARLVDSSWLTVITKNAELNKRYKPKPPGWNTLNVAVCASDARAAYTLADTLCYHDQDTGYDTDGGDGCRRMLRVGRQGYVVEFLALGGIRGHDMFRRAMEDAMSYADAYILVYAIDSRESFDAVVDWQARLEDQGDAVHERIAQRRAQQLSGLPEQSSRDPTKPWLVGVAATRCEAEPEQIQVEKSDGVGLAARLGCPFWGVSCAVKRNLYECLYGVVNEYAALPARRAEQREREAAAAEAAAVKAEAMRLEDERMASRSGRFWRRSSRRL